MKMYSTAEASTYLGVHPNTLRKAITAGKLAPDKFIGKQKQFSFAQATLDKFKAEYMNRSSELLTRQDIARRFGVDAHTVWRALQARNVEPAAYRSKAKLYRLDVAEWLAGVEEWRNGKPI